MAKYLNEDGVGLMLQNINNHINAKLSNYLPKTTPIPDEVELIEISGDMLADVPTYTAAEAQAIVDAYDADKLIALNSGTTLYYGSGWFIPNIFIRKQQAYRQLYISGILGNFYIEQSFIYDTSSGSVQTVDVDRKLDLSEIGGSSTYAYGDCSTAASTSAKEVVLSDSNFTVSTGSIVAVKFTNAHTATSMTLNVNNSVKSCLYRNAAVGSGIIVAGGVYDFVYDGTNWQLLGGVVPTSVATLTTTRYINGLGFNGSANRTNYATCTTAAATAAKTASVTGYSLLTGSQVRVKFNNANTASAPTLNITSTGAKSMRYKGVVITGSNFTFDTTKIYTFTYTDGYYDLEGDWDQAGSSVDAAIDGIAFDGTTDITRFAICDTAANTVAKTATIEGFKVATGARISLYMQNGHTTPTMTLNINSLGAKTVFYGGQSYLPALGVGTYDFVYTSGDTWDLVTNKPKSIRAIGGTTASGALQPNQFFKFSNALTSLNVSATPTNVPNAEYSCEFTAASTGCSFTYPLAWKWANGIVPTIEAGKTYQLSVTNNCAVIASFF